MSLSPFSLSSTAFKTFITRRLTPTCGARLDFQLIKQYLAKLLVFLHQLFNEYLVFQHLNAQESLWSVKYELTRRDIEEKLNYLRRNDTDKKG